MKNSSPPPTHQQKDPQPEGLDPLESRAAEIAKRNGREGVTDADRKAAYQEMGKTAPQQSDDEPASH